MINCWKERILMLRPLLNDEDKVRVKEIIPDYEITHEHMCQLFKTSIKPFPSREKKLSPNCHDFKINDGVCASGTRNHCILIDGSKGSMGEFTDPVKEFGTKVQGSE